MIREDLQRLLGSYVTGSLNKSESDLLLRASLEDQEVFDELLAVERLRNAFHNPQFRAQVQTDLRARVASQSTPWRERLLRLVLVPAIVVAAAVVLIFMFRPSKTHEEAATMQVALGTNSGPLISRNELVEMRAAERSRFAEKNAPAPEPASDGFLAFDRTGNTPIYHLGDPLRMGFKIPQDAVIVVLEEHPGGDVIRLFPNKFQSSPPVSGGTLVLIPPSGQGPMAVEGPLGLRTVRVLVFPRDVDPFDTRTPWDIVRKKATSLSRTYEVRP